MIILHMVMVIPLYRYTSHVWGNPYLFIAAATLRLRLAQSRKAKQVILSTIKWTSTTLHHQLIKVIMLIMISKNSKYTMINVITTLFYPSFSGHPVFVKGHESSKTSELRTTVMVSIHTITSTTSSCQPNHHVKHIVRKSSSHGGVVDPSISPSTHP